jgi:hypothetical protein
MRVCDANAPEGATAMRLLLGCPIADLPPKTAITPLEAPANFTALKVKKGGGNQFVLKPLCGH